MKSWRTGTVPVSGGFLAYHRTGRDLPPLVLSHGLTDNGLCWSRLAAALESDFDVVMLDARGHGASSRASADQPHDPARDLGEAIAALRLESPSVMGHSVGARATAAYANAFPAQVAKVVLEDPPFLPLADAVVLETRRRKFAEQVARLHAMTAEEILALGRTTSPGWHDDDLPAWATSKQQVDAAALPTYATPWQEEIGRISAPTLLVHGEAERGSLVTPAIVSEAMATNGRIRAVEIAGAGHNVRRENFADYLAAVRPFLLNADAGRQ